MPDSPRALPAAELARAWTTLTGRPADGASDDADMALDLALEAASTEGGVLVVAGSLYLVGHVRGRLLSVTIIDDA